MLKAVCLVTFAVYCVSAERISNVESPSWNRRTTTEDYGYGRDRASSYDRDESVRGAGSSDLGGSRYGSDYGVTDRWGSPVTSSPGRHTYSWERSTGRSSYLDHFTTQSPYESSYDRYSSRRPSYQTDRWGDPIGGSGTTRSSWGSSSDRDRTDRYGDTFGSVWDRTTSRYGLGSYTTRSWLHSDRDSHGSASRYDRNEAYVRIQIELVKFSNDKGVTIDGSKCDSFGQCDPIVRGFLDTERPNADFPGARDSKYWPVIFQTDDKNTFDFRNANLTRDVCGVPYRDVTLRVLIEDEDAISKNDIVNKFDCPITREPDSSEILATWHSNICTPKQQSQMKLTFRYKVYVIPRSRCDTTSGVLNLGATTKRRH